MNEQIEKVLYHIEQNLDSFFELEELAKIAGYSKYHFCRIFKLNVGESMMEYITRLRLQKAQLKVTENGSIIDIALDVGYETPNGFNKAFKKTFGMSPSQYKKIKTDFLKKFKGKLMETPKIVRVEDRYVVFTREVGEYITSSKIAWENLSKSLNSLVAKLANSDEVISLDVKKAELLGICHDDPTITKPESIRYDAAISWSKDRIDFLSKYDYKTKKIEGGSYAMTTHFGDSDKTLDSWFGLYGWCEDRGYRFRDVPPFEKYVNIIEQIDNPKAQITEIYIPIEG